MTTLEMLEVMKVSGYSLALIARQCSIRYHTLNRFYAGSAELHPTDETAVRRFCQNHPCVKEAKK